MQNKGTCALLAVVAMVGVAGGATSASAQCAGGSWTAVGNPTDSAVDNGTVFGLAAWDHDASAETPKRVVATGSFSTAGGNPMARIAMWDGAAWQPFGAGITGTDGRALIVRDNGDLVVAGNISSADGVPSTGRIASWTPGASTFAPFGSGFAAGVALSLTSYHGAGGTGPEQIIMGGQSFSGGFSRIAAWNGEAWDTMNGGMSSLVAALAELENGDLVAGGSFATAGGVAAKNIARWDGSAWHPLGDGTGMDGNSGLIRCLLAMPNGDLIVGGSFLSAGPAANVVNYIARWDGTTWHSMAGGMSNGTGDNNGVFALMLLPSGDVLAGGNFGTAGTATALNVARWDGTAWHAFGAPGLGGGTVHSFTQIDGTIYAGGAFATADGNPATRFAMFTPSTTALADIGEAGGLPGTDGALDNNDFIAFINFFFASDPAADFGVAGGLPGQDGQFDNNDFIAFINAFFIGCP